jgi:hypothetical protein
LLSYRHNISDCRRVPDTWQKVNKESGGRPYRKDSGWRRQITERA